MIDNPVFNTSQTPSWCPGCGNFGIWYAMKAAFTELGLAPHELSVVHGIGCSGNLANFIRSFGFHSLHGRTLPVATGIKLANKDLVVVATGGDGDGLGIGIGHFVHTCRRNIDITYIIHNNRIYGLTTGQTSPTSPEGFVSKSTPFGVLEQPVNPTALAILMGAAYVARGYSGDIDHLASLVSQGVRHRGFSVIEVLQPCVTFNPGYSYPFLNPKVYRVDDAGHDVTDRTRAMEVAQERGERIPIGLFYRTEHRSYDAASPELDGEPLVMRSCDGIDVMPIVEEMIAT